jgi:hypothetical protein
MRREPTVNKTKTHLKTNAVSVRFRDGDFLNLLRVAKKQHSLVAAYVREVVVAAIKDDSNGGK